MDDLIKRLENGLPAMKALMGGYTLDLDKAQSERMEAAAALSEAQATIARLEAENAHLMSLEGAAEQVLRFITNPDWADKNSEIFRTTPWQALYNEMRQDKDDFPALVRTFLEAFTCKEFREELDRAALSPREGEG